MGYWSGLDDVRNRLHIERVFEPSPDKEKQVQRYKGWKKAVSRALQWIDKEDWIYEVSFDAGALTRGYEHVRLEFLGLDTYADVFLNETQILTADNMFRRWAAEVKPLLKERGNVLRVYFHSPIKKALPQYESLPYRYEAWNDQADNGGLDGKNSALSPARRAIITAGTGVRGWLRRASGVR